MISIKVITCIVRVPGLLSSSPWMSKIGFLILLADMNGLISTYTLVASHRVRSSFWQVFRHRWKVKQRLVDNHLNAEDGTWKKMVRVAPGNQRASVFCCKRQIELFRRRRDEEHVPGDLQSWTLHMSVPQQRFCLDEPPWKMEDKKKLSSFNSFVRVPWN